jgi:hypothetical protein
MTGREGVITKQVNIYVPEDLHSAMKQVATIELRSLHQQCLHCFYEMCKQYGYDIPVSYEDGQKLYRKQRHYEKLLAEAEESARAELTGRKT